MTCGDNLELAVRSRRALVRIMRGQLVEAEGALGAIEAEALARGLWGEGGFATAQLALIAALIGRDSAWEAVERGVRLFRRSGHLYTGAVLTPVAAALAARAEGAELATSGLLAGADIRPSTALAVLAAVEAGDVSATRAALRHATWRWGMQHRSSHASLTIAAALVEAGDFLDDRALVAAGAPVLRTADRSGVRLMTGWPVSVARLLAVVARCSGHHDEAVLHLNRAALLCRRQGLMVEQAKLGLESTRRSCGTGRRRWQLSSSPRQRPTLISSRCSVG